MTILFCPEDYHLNTHRINDSQNYGQHLSQNGRGYSQYPGDAGFVSAYKHIDPSPNKLKKLGPNILDIRCWVILEQTPNSSIAHKDP